MVTIWRFLTRHSVLGICYFGTTLVRFFLFLPVYYTSVLFEKTNLIERKVIDKMICFIIYPSCPVLVSLLCNISEISGFYSCALFIIKINTKSAFSFVSYLLGYSVFEIMIDNLVNLFFISSKSLHLDIYIYSLSSSHHDSTICKNLTNKALRGFTIFILLTKFFRVQGGDVLSWNCQTCLAWWQMN